MSHVESGHFLLYHGVWTTECWIPGDGDQTIEGRGGRLSMEMSC